MKENLRHKEAFEYYYSLGAERNLEKVAQKYSVSIPAVKKWSKAFNWQKRVEQRDITIAQELEKKTTAEVVYQKADYRKDIAEMLEPIRKAIHQQKQRLESGNITCRTPEDFSKLISIYEHLAKLDLELMGETNPVERVVIDFED